MRPGVAGRRHDQVRNIQLLIYRPSSMNDRRGSDGTRRSIMRGGSAFTGFGVAAGFGGFGAATRGGFGNPASFTRRAASAASSKRQSSSSTNTLAWRKPTVTLTKPRRSALLDPEGHRSLADADRHETFARNSGGTAAAFDFVLDQM